MREQILALSDMLASIEKGIEIWLYRNLHLFVIVTTTLLEYL